MAVISAPAAPKEALEAREGEPVGVLSNRVLCCKGDVVLGRWGVYVLGDIAAPRFGVPEGWYVPDGPRLAGRLVVLIGMGVGGRCRVGRVLVEILLVDDAAEWVEENDRPEKGTWKNVPAGGWTFESLYLYINTE